MAQGDRKLGRRDLLLGAAALVGCEPAPLLRGPTRRPRAQTASPASAVPSLAEPQAPEPPVSAPSPTAEAIPCGLAALTSRWPELGALPWRNVLEVATPLVPLPVEELGFAELWLKQDAQSAPGYGGSKPRKLEPLFGSALAQGIEEVCTFGALGSNHVAATAVHAKRLGLASRAYLLPAPLDEHGRRNLELCQLAGAKLLRVGSQREAEAKARRWLGRRSTAALFPWGGSSAVGDLGCVAAGLELAAQFDRAGVPPPDYVFVAGGTLGTAVGLALGLRAAQLPTQLVVMRASNRAPFTQAHFERELRATRGLLTALAPALAERLTGPAPPIDDSQLGAGYALPTRAGRAASAWMLEHAGFALDLTYTGKAFAGVLAQAPQLKAKRVVFWQTLDPSPQGT